jgi:hypothetical protein
MGVRASGRAADTLLLTHHRQDEQEYRMQSDFPAAGRPGQGCSSGKVTC